MSFTKKRFYLSTTESRRSVGCVFNLPLFQDDDEPECVNSERNQTEKPPFFSFELLVFANLKINNCSVMTKNSAWYLCYGRKNEIPENFS